MNIAVRPYLRRMSGFYDTPVPDLVPREQMPQVDEDDYPALVHFAASLGVETRKLLLPTDELLAHQAVDEDRVRRITTDGWLLRKPVLVSREPYVLDGNHRVAAHRSIGTPVPALEFPLPFAAAVQMLFRFPRTWTTGQERRIRN